MEIVRTLLIVLEAIISLLLIGVILLQRSKSEGLGLAFGAGMGESLFGSRAGNVLTRVTIILAALFLVNTLVLANLFTQRKASLLERELQQESDRVPAEFPDRELPGTAEPEAGEKTSGPVSSSVPESAPAPVSVPER